MLLQDPNYLASCLLPYFYYTFIYIAVQHIILPYNGFLLYFGQIRPG